MAYSKEEVTMMLFKSGNDWRDLVGGAVPPAPNLFSDASYQVAPANNNFRDPTATAVTYAQLESARAV